jgi:hypothetical protein
MALWKRGRRYWTYFSVNGVQIRRPLCREGSTLATTNWHEAGRLEKEMIRAAVAGELAPRNPLVKLFAAVDDYLEAKKATANSERTIEFDRERLEIVKRHLGDVKLSAITRKLIEGFQAKRRLDGASNRTVNMDVAALRQVLKRFKQWRRLEDDVKMLTEAGGPPVGRAQKRLFESAASNPEWEHATAPPSSPRTRRCAGSRSSISGAATSTWKRCGTLIALQGRACCTSVTARMRRANVRFR